MSALTITSISIWADTALVKKGHTKKVKWELEAMQLLRPRSALLEILHHTLTGTCKEEEFDFVSI